MVSGLVMTQTAMDTACKITTFVGRYGDRMFSFIKHATCNVSHGRRYEVIPFMPDVGCDLILGVRLRNESALHVIPHRAGCYSRTAEFLFWRLENMLFDIQQG